MQGEIELGDRPNPGLQERDGEKALYRAYAKLGVENRLQVINLLLLKNAIESGSISDILRSAATRAVAFAARVALALAEAMSDWDLTFDFL